MTNFRSEETRRHDGWRKSRVQNGSGTRTMRIPSAPPTYAGEVASLTYDGGTRRSLMIREGSNSHDEIANSSSPLASTCRTLDRFPRLNSTLSMVEVLSAENRPKLHREAVLIRLPYVRICIDISLPTIWDRRNGWKSRRPQVSTHRW